MSPGVLREIRFEKKGLRERNNADELPAGWVLERAFNLTQISESGTPKSYHEQIGQENCHFARTSEIVPKSGKISDQIETCRQSRRQGFGEGCGPCQSTSEEGRFQEGHCECRE